MSSTTKNIVVVLLALTFAFAAYYFYIQSKSSPEMDEDLMVTDEILMNAQLFMEHRATLDAVQMDTTIFENDLFLSYQSFTQPLQDEPYGRENPFVKTSVGY